MSTFLRFDISFFSTLLLIVVLITLHIRKDTLSTSTKLFKRLILINIYMLLLEIVSWQFDQKPGQFNWYANYISNMLFAWSTPLITCAWTSYIDYHIFKSIERLRRRWFYVHALIVNTIFMIINLFTPFIFSVSPDNVYAREPFMWLIVAMNSVFLMYISMVAYKNRHRINKEIVISILLFIFMPAVAAFIQVVVYGAFVLWPTMAISIVITYIFLETVSTSKDYLTGLTSRHRVDDYIDFLIASKTNFGLIMIDLDKFKEINDTYGHINGDQALKVFSKVLKQTFKQAKVVGRYAGDEFIVVTEVLTPKELEHTMKQLRREIDIERDIIKFDYKIEFSLGYQTWDKEKNYDYETLVNLTDQKMYQMKNA